MSDKNNLDKLHQQYGSLLIQFEIIQAKLNNIKQAIVNEMNGSQQKGTPDVAVNRRVSKSGK